MTEPSSVRAASMSAWAGARPRLRVPAGVIFLLWSLWLSAEYWMAGDLSYLRIHDNANVHIPLALHFTSSWTALISAGITPWLCGVDRLSNFGGPALFHLPFLWLPAWLAHGMLICLQRWVASYFAFRLLRDVAGSPRSLAIAGGMLYSVTHTDLGEYCFMHMLNEPGLPLLLWLFCRMPADGWGRASLWAIGMGVVLGWNMSVITGTAFLLPAAALFAVVVRRDAWRGRGLSRLVMGWSLFLLVSALPQVLPLWALATEAPMTYRGQSFGGGEADWGRFFADRLRYLLSWWAFLPGVLWGLTRLQLRREPVDRALLVLLLTGVVAGPLAVPLKSLMGDHLGFFGGVDFSRFHMVSGLALGLVLIRGLGDLPRWTLRIMNGEAREVRAMALPSVAALLIAASVVGWSVSLKRDHLHAMKTEGVNWRSNYGNPDIARLARISSERLERMAAVGAHHAWHPGYLLAYGASTPDGHAPAYRMSYYRFWSAVIRPLLDKDPYLRGFHQWGSYVYLHHARTGPEYSRQEIPLKEWYNLNLLSLAGTRFLVSSKPVADDRLQEIPPEIYLKRLEAWAGLSARQRVRGYLAGDNPGRRLYFYENEGAFPRFFLVPKVRRFNSEDAMWEAMERSSSADLRSAVYVCDEAPEMRSSGEPQASTVDVLKASPEYYRVRTQTKVPQVLVMTNQYYPWWRCRINGREQTIFPAYGAFIAILLPEGGADVEFEYSPPWNGWLRRRFASWGF